MDEEDCLDDLSVIFERFMAEAADADGPHAMDIVMAENAGISVDEYLAINSYRDRCYEEGKLLDGKPVSEWPSFELEWDLAPENFHLVVDGQNRQQFEQDNPAGFAVKYVYMKVLQNNLNWYSKRPDGVFWTDECGRVSSLYSVIGHSLLGGKLTPSLIGMTNPMPPDIKKELCIRAGHHRMAVAKEKNLAVVPILVACDEIAEVSSHIELHNANPASF